MELLKSDLGFDVEYKDKIGSDYHSFGGSDLELDKQDKNSIGDSNFEKETPFDEESMLALTNQ